MAPSKLRISAALCTLFAPTLAQLSSESCFWTSTVIYGGQSTFQTFSSMNTPVLSSTSPAPNSISSASSGVESSSMISPGVLSTPSTSISSTASPSPLPAFIIQAFDSTTKTKRAVRYATVGQDSYIFLQESSSNSATFSISPEGYLLSERMYAGPHYACDSCSVHLQLSEELPPNTMYKWTFDGSRLSFGDATFCSGPEIGLAALYVVFGDGPINGCIELTLVAEPVSAASTSFVGSISLGTVPGSSSAATSTVLPSFVSSVPQSSSTVIAISLSSPIVSSTTASSIAPSQLSAPNSPTTHVTAMSTPTSPVSPVVSSTTTQVSSSISPILSSLSSASQSSSSSASISQPSPSTNSPSSFSARSSISRTSSATSTSISSSAPISAVTSISSSQPTSASNSTAALSSPTNTPSSSTTSSVPRSTSSLSSSSSSTNSPASTSISTSASTSTFLSTPSSSTSSTFSSSSPISTPNILPGKRGLAYSNVNQTYYYPPPTQVSWAYNYYYAPNSSSSRGIFPRTSSYPLRFSPLLFNDDGSLAAAWPSAVSYAIVNYGTDAIFSFNEPDLCVGGSACMTVSRALIAYNKSIQPFAGQTRLVAPAVTNAGSGFAWLRDFLGNASLPQWNLTVDVVNIHWYASPYNMQYFIDYMTNASILAAGRPIWITEYGMDNSNYYEPHVQQFIKNTTYWCDQQSFIERYAWFGNYPNNLLNSTGTGLSARGVLWDNYVGTDYVYGFPARVAAEAKVVDAQVGSENEDENGVNEGMDGENVDEVRQQAKAGGESSWSRGMFPEKMWWKNDGHMDGK